MDPPGWNKVKLTFSELNNKNHKIGGKLSVKTTVWLLEVVVCYNENKNDNTDFEIVLLFDHLPNEELFVWGTRGSLIFPSP